MMKNEFLARLKELLCDLPQEERDEAIRYYEDYFEDAGPLEEPRVLKELISPEDVAEKIRAGYIGREKTDVQDAPAQDVYEKVQEDAAEFRQDMSGEEVISEQEDMGAQGFSRNQEDARLQDERMRMGEDYAQDYGQYNRNERRHRAGGYGGEDYPHSARAKSYVSPVIVILALVFGLPIICPVLLAFICMMGCFFLAFGLGGIGLITAGVVVIGSALTHLSIGSGLVCLLSGGGLILTAFGILFIVFAINCAFRAIPSLFRGIRNIILAVGGRRAWGKA